MHLTYVGVWGSRQLTPTGGCYHQTLTPTLSIIGVPPTHPLLLHHMAATACVIRLHIRLYKLYKPACLEGGWGMGDGGTEPSTGGGGEGEGAT